MWRWIGLGLVGITVVVFGFSLIDAGGTGSVAATADLAVSNVDANNFTRAITPRTFEFPRDHGPHHDFQTEWWYYTGNVAAEDGRRFGYQFTIFRRAFSPEDNATESEWRTNQAYLAHFTVADIGAEAFHHDERLMRGGAGLAGAEIEPRYRVWLEDWQVIGLNDDANAQRITAAMDDGTAIDLTLTSLKQPSLQGENGLSAKSDEPGNASYYYSLTRLETEGTITADGVEYAVRGYSWKDREWSTSALTEGAIGWDWFSLQLDDNREMMLGYIRKQDGSQFDYGASMTLPDGSQIALDYGEDYTIEATDTWTSPHTGATYPSGWNVTVNVGEGDPLNLTLTPLMRDQELQVDVGAYWEGALRINGDATGYGYAELTGYVEAMGRRF
jgi:predicted secreted hydrolase